MNASEPAGPGLLALAQDFREALRHSIYLVRRLDADGELSAAQFSTLKMLLDAGNAPGPTGGSHGVRVGEIARNLGVKVPSATEQIIKLERAGLARREPDPRRLPRSPGDPHRGRSRRRRLLQRTPQRRYGRHPLRPLGRRPCRPRGRPAGDRQDQRDAAGLIFTQRFPSFRSAPCTASPPTPCRQPKLPSRPKKPHCSNSPRRFGPRPSRRCSPSWESAWWTPSCPRSPKTWTPHRARCRCSSRAISWLPPSPC